MAVRIENLYKVHDPVWRIINIATLSGEDAGSFINIMTSFKYMKNVTLYFDKYCRITAENGNLKVFQALYKT